jgi:hypothetical protein
MAASSGPGQPSVSRGARGRIPPPHCVISHCAPQAARAARPAWPSAPDLDDGANRAPLGRLGRTNRRSRSRDQAEELDHVGLAQVLAGDNDQPRVDPMQRAERPDVAIPGQFQCARGDQSTPVGRARLAKNDSVRIVAVPDLREPVPHPVVTVVRGCDSAQPKRVEVHISGKTGEHAVEVPGIERIHPFPNDRLRRPFARHRDPHRLGVARTVAIDRARPHDPTSRCRN